MSDVLASHRHPHMARGHFMYGGMAVVIDDQVPRAYIGDHIRLFWPASRWLRWLFPLRFVPAGRYEVDQVFKLSGKLFMTSRAWEELKRQTKP